MVLISSLQYIIKPGQKIALARRQSGEEKSMALTRDEVLHVADLARLSLAPEEIEASPGNSTTSWPMSKSCRNWTPPGWNPWPT